MDGLKFCKDCKHCKPHWFNGLSSAKCARKGERLDPVTGKMYQIHMHHCSYERSEDFNCGEFGRYWEAK